MGATEGKGNQSCHPPLLPASVMVCHPSAAPRKVIFGRAYLISIRVVFISVNLRAAMIPGRAGGKKPKEEDTGVKNRQRDLHDGLDLKKRK